MAITNAGKYIGYTLGGGMPTLYFENGHYTQVHNNANNVGWHPIPAGVDCFRININAKGYIDYRAATTTEGKSTFAQKVLSKPNDYTDNTNAATLCEIFMRGCYYYGRHLSRSRLIRVGADDFDQRFDQAYADRVLARGALAPNEC